MSETDACLPQRKPLRRPIVGLQQWVSSDRLRGAHDWTWPEDLAEASEALPLDDEGKPLVA
jgi:hypothetical protein